MVDISLGALHSVELVIKTEVPIAFVHYSGRRLPFARRAPEPTEPEGGHSQNKLFVIPDKQRY